MLASYIDELKAFDRWLETNYLPGQSQLLWYKLISLCNRSGWAEWVTVDNRRLMLLADINTEKTLIRSREKLIDAGLIEYQKGKKGSPGRYRLISIYCKFYSTNDSKSDSTNVSHIKTIKTKTKTISCARARERKTSFDLDEYERLTDNLPDAGGMV